MGQFVIKSYGADMNARMELGMMGKENVSCPLGGSALIQWRPNTTTTLTTTTMLRPVI